MHRFLSIEQGGAGCPRAGAIAGCTWRRSGGCGAGIRCGVRRDLARPGSKRRWLHVWGDHVLDAPQAVELAHPARRLPAYRAVRRMSRLPGVRAASLSEALRKQVSRSGARSRWPARAQQKADRHKRAGAGPAALFGADLCAAGAARGAEPQITSPARAGARAGFPSSRRDLFRCAEPRATADRCGGPRGRTRLSRRGDSVAARQARVAPRDRRNAGGARGLR